MLPLKNCKVTSPYGVKRTINGKTSIHKGIDLISESGDVEVKAIRAGVLRGNFQDPAGYGNYTSIEHTDGTRALYCHLKSFKRKAGEMIKEGEVIGIEGSSGNSTGMHLHLEIRDTPYLQHDHINVADYLGIKNDYGLVQIIEEFKDGDELAALDYLVETGRITDKEYALEKLAVVNKEKWYLIKWANDVKVLLS